MTEPRKTQDLPDDHESVSVTEVPKPAENIETRCPHCGMLPSEAATVPTDTETRAFLEAILTGGRFSKTYTVFGGKIEVELEDLSELETADVHKAVMEYNAAKSSEPPMSRPTLAGVSASYQLAHSLKRLVIDGKDVMKNHPKVPVTPEAFSGTSPSIARTRYWALLGDLPSSIVSALVAKQLEFGSLVLALVRHAADPDFFSGIG